jgi:hypothetical protein
MLVETLLCLLLGLSLYLTRIHNELILHYDGHIPNPQLGLLRLNQPQFDLIVLLQELLMLSLPLQFLPLLLGEEHR